MSGRNMQEAFGVYNILSYTYVHLIVLISYLIAQCKVMHHLKSMNLFLGLHYSRLITYLNFV
jgi:hypothetical protein